MTASSERLPRRRTDVLLLDTASRSLLVADDQQVTHVLNPTARAIWELCDGATTVEELVAAICSVFDVGHDAARADVTAALEQLAAAGLVSWSGQGRVGP